MFMSASIEDICMLGDRKTKSAFKIYIFDILIHVVIRSIYKFVSNKPQNEHVPYINNTCFDMPCPNFSMRQHR